MTLDKAESRNAYAARPTMLSPSAEGLSSLPDERVDSGASIARGSPRGQISLGTRRQREHSDMLEAWARQSGLGKIEKDGLLRRREDERAGLRETEHEGGKAPLASCRVAHRGCLSRLSRPFWILPGRSSAASSPEIPSSFEIQSLIKKIAF